MATFDPVAESKRSGAVMRLDLSQYAMPAYLKKTNDALSSIGATTLDRTQFVKMCMPLRGRWDAKMVLYRILQKDGLID